MQSLQALILLGGKGTHLYPLTYSRPKALLPLLNRPLIAYTLEQLQQAGVREVIFLLGSEIEGLEDVIGQQAFPDLSIHYLFEKRSLGPGGAIKKAEPLLRGTFLVLYGDYYNTVPLSEMLAFHQKKQSLLTVSLARVPEYRDFDVFRIDPRGHITGLGSLTASDQPGWVSTGIQILEPEVLPFIPAGLFSSLPQHIFPRLLEAGRPFFGFGSEAYWTDIRAPEQYLKDQEHLLLERLLLPANSAHTQSAGAEVWIGQHTFFDNSVQFEGLVVIGENCILKDGVRIYGPTIIGNHCHLFAQAQLNNTVLWDHVTIDKKAELSGCLVGEGSWIGAGCKIHPNVLISDCCTIGAGRELFIGETLGPHTTLLGK